MSIDKRVIKGINKGLSSLGIFSSLTGLYVCACTDYSFMLKVWKCLWKCRHVIFNLAEEALS